MNEFVIKNGFISQGTSYVSNGNLGVGVTSPTSRLEVKGVDSTSSNYGLKVQNSGGTDNFVIRNNGKLEANISTDSNSWDFTNTVGTAIFKIDSVDYSIMQLYAAGVQRYFLQAGNGTNFLRLLSPSFEVRSNSNNVIQMFDAVNETIGIGTTTPTAKLEVKSNSSTGDTMYPFSVTNYPGSNVLYLSNQNYYVDPNNLGVYSYIYDNQFNIELAGSSGQFKLNRGVNKFWMNPYPNVVDINLLVESSIGGGGGSEAGIRHVFTSTSGGGTIYGESLYVGTDSSTGTTTIVGNFIGKQGFTNPNATFYPLIVMDGNVGIGTSTPTSKLQIKDDTNSGIPRLQINTYTGNGGTNNKGLYITGNIDSSSDILCLLEHTNFAGGGGNGKIFKAAGGNGGNKTTFDIEDKGYVRIGDTGITSNSAVHVKWTPNSFVPNSNIGNQDTFGLNIEHLYEVSGQSSNKYGLKIDSTGYYQPANTTYKNYGIFVNTDTGVGTGTTYAAVFNGGNVGIGTSAPTSQLDINGTNGYNQLRLRTSYTPSGSTDINGNIGDVGWDDNYFYWKTSTQWLRISGQTW